MLSALEFVVLILAIGQIIEIWQHSALFAGWRSWLDLYEDHWWGVMLRCPFCFGVWLAVFLVLVGYGLPVWFSLSAKETAVVQFPLYALGALRAAQVLNDLTHSYCRTPKIEDRIPVDDE